MKLYKCCDSKTKRHHSIFFRLIFIVLLSGLLLNFVVGAFFKIVIKSHVENVVRSMVVGYTNYIIEDIGLPFDTTRALEITKESPIDIYYKGPDFEWQTERFRMRFTESSHSDGFFYGDSEFGLRLGRVYANIIKNGHEYRLCTDLKESLNDVHEKSIIVLLIVLTLIIILMHHAIRKTLKPIKLLLNGTKKVGDGDLDYRIPVVKYDELGELSNAFNCMTEKVGEMVSAKEQLLLDVSHELRTPITRAKIALEFLPDSDAKTSIGDDLVEMSSMVTEILESERLNSDHGKLDIERYNIFELVNDVIVNHNVAETIVIANNFPENIILYFDRKRIRTVLNNILENAIKYSETEKRPVEISSKENGEYFYITIEDFGVGISNDNLPYLFEPFYRVDKSRSKETGGYGLGMSLSKKIMESHRGTIEVKSEVGKGTIVTLGFLIEI